MAENVAETIENVLNELRRLQDIELHVAEALRRHGLTLVKTAAGYDVMKLGEITAQSEKKSPEQSDQLQQEPFGYFRAEPFGWTDCAETDEGAVALYERPPAPHESEYKRAHEQWLDKTEWVQETVKAGELGMHRADVLRQRIKALEGSGARSNK